MAEHNIEIIPNMKRAFNIALQQNNIPLIDGIEIINRGNCFYKNCRIEVSSDNAFFDLKNIEIGEIHASSPYPYPISVELTYHPDYLMTLSEMQHAKIFFRLFSKENLIAETSEEIDILAYDQWAGGGYKELLAAYVTPTHPMISQIMREASLILKQEGKAPLLEGYQAWNHGNEEYAKNRIIEMISAAYRAIQNRQIAYANPPASFYDAQRIRTCDTVLTEGLGTCLDMAILFASVMEGIRLTPVLILLKDHAFVCVWLNKNIFKNVITTDPKVIADLVANHELVPIECTAMCVRQRNISFKDAVNAATENIYQISKFDAAIDIAVARHRQHRIKPIPLRIYNRDEVKLVFENPIAEENDDVDTSFIAVENVPELNEATAATKFDVWESKLLNLDQRNKLINLKMDAAVLPLFSGHVEELENALAGREVFDIIPPYFNIPAQIDLYSDIAWTGNGADFIRDIYLQNQLISPYDKKKLNKVLANIFKEANSDIEEKGANNLFLTIGLLQWIDKKAKVEKIEENGIKYGVIPCCMAPLLLVPVELFRESVKSGYKIRMRDDEIKFNHTLLEKLRRDFKLNISGLDPLPKDEKGVNVRKVLSIVKQAVMKLEGWEVKESTYLANFDYDQYLMWEDIHFNHDVLEQNKIVRSIIKGHTDWQPIDQETIEQQHVYMPVSLDEHQIKAVKRALCDDTFILHGPPGTGKSQTITMMIANALAQGKKVLFVAEKEVALTVVRDRLREDMHLENYCLQISGAKKEIDSVLRQFNQTLNAAPVKSRTMYKTRVQQSIQSQEILNTYAEKLYTVHPCGYCLRELIDRYLAIKTEEYIPFTRRQAESITAEQYLKHEQLIKSLIFSEQSVGRIHEHPLRDIRLSSFNYQIKNTIEQAISDCQTKIQVLNQCIQAIAELAKIPAPEIDEAWDGFMNRMQLVLDSAKIIDEGKISDDAAKALTNFLALKEDLQQEKTVLTEFWTEDALSIDVASWLKLHADAAEKIFGKNKAIANFMSALSKFMVKDSAYEAVPELLECIASYQQKKAALDELRNALPDEADYFINNGCSIGDIETLKKHQNFLEENAAAFPGGAELFKTLCRDAHFIGNVVSLNEKMNQAHDSWKHLNVLLKRNPKTEEKMWWIEAADVCDRIQEHDYLLGEWASFNRIAENCENAGLSPVVQAWRSGMDKNLLYPAYCKGIYYALIRKIIDEDQVLSDFNGLSFNTEIEKYKALDTAIMQDSLDEIHYLLAEGIPDPYESPETGREYNLLKKAISCSGKGMTIRGIFDKIPSLLQRLYPCMLMSPDSVAQYLPMQADMFDLVIFDEASQLPTCKAVGALARAKNAVIVGDPKQMPPTKKIEASSYEDTLELEDLDSVLDDCLALTIPSVHLQWHYRSQHESLIAFSNVCYYDGNMLTYPSINDQEQKITYYYIGGTFEESKNLKEAEAIVSELQKLYKQYKQYERKEEAPSVGVIAFSLPQMKLIDKLVEKAGTNDPGFFQWIHRKEDGVFIKELDNSQGDERDIILFSIAYGSHANGKASYIFGHIERPDGWKRLNVAFSRAKKEMRIFSSMKWEEIPYDKDKSSIGHITLKLFLLYAETGLLITLKLFLLYAETGLLNESKEDDSVNKEYQKGEITGNTNQLLDEQKKDDSVNKEYQKGGITGSICQLLSEHGFDYQCNLGRSDFKIDIAVKNPYIPQQYLAGIMLDGDTYHLTKSTRDREIAQLAVLDRMGWHIHRIWTLDWWENRRNETKRLLHFLNQEKQRVKAALLKQQRELEEKKRQAEARREAEAAALIQARLQAETDEMERQTKIKEAEARAKEMGLKTLFKKPDKEEIAGNTGVKTKDNTDNTDHLAYDYSRNILCIDMNCRFPSSQTIINNLSEQTTSDIQEETLLETVEKNEDALKYQEAEYRTAVLEEDDWVLSDFVAPDNFRIIKEKAERLLQTESPIKKDVFVRKILKSFGLSKSKTANEVIDKALKSIHSKSTRQKGDIYCWHQDMDPKGYAVFRIGEEAKNARSAGDICQQEIKNALSFVLSEKGVPLERKVLFKETAKIFGYEQVSSAMTDALNAGLKYAKNQKILTAIENGEITLLKTEKE